MTKEEKIKDAYIEYFDICNPDENGWTKWTQSNRFSSLEFNSDLNLMRPLELKGIENNNGWIKIESEEDLPENGYYEVILRGSGNDSRATLDREFNKKAQLMRYSHYQPIINTKPPIY